MLPVVLLVPLPLKSSSAEKDTPRTLPKPAILVTPLPEFVVSASSSAEVSPMSVNSQGLNSPRFQSRQAEQRAHGWWCISILDLNGSVDVQLQSLQLCAKSAPTKGGGARRGGVVALRSE